jgi:hypothetical protein
VAWADACSTPWIDAARQSGLEVRASMLVTNTAMALKPDRISTACVTLVPQRGQNCILSQRPVSSERWSYS